MPASKPTKLPRWASGATAQITEPNEGKKDLGHQVAEKPPAQYFNWLFNLIYAWVAWLNDFEIVAHTWAALQTFAGGLSVTGNIGATGDITAGGKVAATGNLEAGGDLSSVGNLTVGGQATINSALAVTGEVDHSNRLKSGAPINATDLKLVSEHPGYGVGAGSVRRYVSGAGATLKLYEVVNATSEGGTWFREVAGQPAFLTELGVAGSRQLAWPVGDATAFTREVNTSEAGVKWLGVGTGATGANPPATTAVANELRAANTPKAWGALQINADNTLAILDGFNIASVAAISGGILVTLAADIDSADYCVVLGTGFLSSGGTGNPMACLSTYDKAAGSFKLQAHRCTDQVECTFTSEVKKIDFAVFGRMTT